MSNHTPLASGVLVIEQRGLAGFPDDHEQSKVQPWLAQTARPGRVWSRGDRGVILENDAPDERAGYRRCVTTNQRADGAEAPARRWLAAGIAESQRPTTVVVAAAAGAVILTIAVGPGGHSAGMQLLLPVLAGAFVVVLRRWPLPVLAVVTATAGTVTATGHVSLPVGILLGVALYAAVLGLPRPKSIALTAAVAAALGATLLYSAAAAGPGQAAATATAIFVPLAGAWCIADSVAARRRYQAGLAAQAAREQAADIREERVRIAREMHDVVAHALAVITVQAGVGRCLAATRPDEATSALSSIETISRTAQDELRVVLGLLRDGEAGSAPLAPTPRLIDVKGLVDTVRAAGVPVELRMSGTGRPLSPSLELSIYRVMQEALTNVVKHAPEARAVAELTVSAGKVRLEVRDDGGPGGAQVPRASLARGHGITGMRERIGAFDGWLVAGPVARGGFQVTAEVPVGDGAS
jgi:signal transduction histidine kinase